MQPATKLFLIGAVSIKAIKASKSIPSLIDKLEKLYIAFTAQIEMNNLFMWTLKEGQALLPDEFYKEYFERVTFLDLSIRAME